MEMYRFFVVFLIAITYPHVTFGAPTSNTEFDQYTLCATDECINTASEIFAKLDRTVDPCDNFYKFACGGWLQNNRANLSFPKIDFFSELRRKTENQLREILEGPAKSNDTISLHKAKHVFEQCMGIKDRKAVEGSNFSTVINKFGGWPIVMSPHDWNKKNLTWQNISTILHENGFDNGLYSIHVWIDNKMSNSNVIVITDPSFVLPRNVLIQLNETLSLKETYIYYIVGIAKNLIEENGGTVEIENLTRDALDIVNFEIELANLTSTYEEQMNLDTFYIPLTIQHLQEEYDKQHPEIQGKIDWRLAIQEMFASEGIIIEPSEKLIVQAYKYLTHLVPLLQRTPSRTIVNYMQWTQISDLFQYRKQPKVSGIARVMMARDNTVHNNSTQLREDDTKWKSCVNQVNLESAISHEYIKKYGSNVNIQAIREMTMDIKSAVCEQIRHSTWMDEPTKEASLEKVEYMRHEFFQPDWYSDQAIDRYFEDLNVSTGYLDNIINILKFEKKQMIRTLRTPVDKKQWFLQPTEPDAYYSPYFNKIVFTAALLQEPVYNESRLPLQNYGTLGFSIAHEISHSFDNNCHRYNKDGNAIPWWTQTIDKYRNITQCFIDQYNDYLVPGLRKNKTVHVKGRWTLPENIADSAGIVAAYHAYKNRKTRLNETEWRMQGLEDYNEDQIFFMIYAQMFCETLPSQVEQEIVWNAHPVKEIRIRGSLSNSREFSEIYNCSSGKPMNPEKKCALWY